MWCACSRRILLVAESAATFNRPLESGFVAAAKAILVTGCGYPDDATIIFLRYLTHGLPCLYIYGGNGALLG